jgi:hypothetical protein
MVSFVMFCVTLVALMPDLNLAFFGSSPQRAVSEPVQRKRSFELPIQRRRTRLSRKSPKRGTDSGTTGLGDFFDQCVVAFYHRAGDLNTVLESMASLSLLEK